jgi:pyruvate dehydrogenase E2 component (dihydrolipoamide acetyltransferase)
MIEITLPALGENVPAGTVVKVAVRAGDTVREGQTLIEVEAEKASIEIPAPMGGIVKEILVKEGEEVRVGQPIMRIEAEGAAAEEKRPEEKRPETREGGARKKPAAPGKKRAATCPLKKEPVPEPEEPKETPSPAPEEEERKPAPVPGGEIPAAPSVRRLAREIGVNLSGVTGTGAGGRITEDDVKARARALLAGAPAAGAAGEALPDFSRWGAVERKPMSQVRLAIMRHLNWAWNTVAHVAHFDKANVTKLEELLKQFSTPERKLTITPFLVRAVSSALKTFPEFNASGDPERREMIYKQYCHIGVAVDTGRGLLVPVIRDADTKNIFQIADELKRLAAKAREGKLSREEMQGGCFTVTNLGGIGGIAFTPIVHWPEVAILGVSRSRCEPVYRDGSFVPQKMIVFSLCYDHRFIDGAMAARFLRWIADAAEQPFVLELEG